MKKVVFLLFCFVQAHAFADSSRCGATVNYIPSREYCTVLTRSIDSARSSIVAVVYLFSLYSENPDVQTTKVASALASAQKRGVAVRVILNRYDPLHAADESDLNASNRAAYEYLKAHDIDVCFGDVPGPLHAKAIIIDSSIVLLGSTNWSEAAFNKNTEANALIQSREFARAALSELGTIRAAAMQDDDTTAARVPLKFMTDTTLLGRMVSSKAEQMFDVYMYLLRQFYLRPPDSALVLDIASLIHYLGMDSLPNEKSRGYVYRDLQKLQDRFGLITRTTQWGKDAFVKLVPMPGGCVSVPAGYFTWNWHRELALPGKVMELVSLYFSSISPDRPQWSRRQKGMNREFGFTSNFIYTGIGELRRKNLLDVEHFPRRQDSEDPPRQANVNMPLPLYDPAVLVATWKSLEAKYGREETDRARKYAGIVFKDCNADAVEKLILLEKHYGTDRMEQAAKKIMFKAVDNPKRSLGYFIGMVQKPGPIVE
jgi:hypothetical protein